MPMPMPMLLNTNRCCCSLFSHTLLPHSTRRVSVASLTRPRVVAGLSYKVFSNRAEHTDRPDTRWRSAGGPDAGGSSPITSVPAESPSPAPSLTSRNCYTTPPFCPAPTTATPSPPATALLVDDAAAATATTAAAGNGTTRKTFDSVSPPKTLFPWRHDPVVLTQPMAYATLPRLRPDTIEAKEAPMISLQSMGQRMVAYHFLKQKLSTSLFGLQAYKKLLAQSSAYAFLSAVAGIISNVYQIDRSAIFINSKQENKTDDNDRSLRFHYNHDQGIVVQDSPTATATANEQQQGSDKMNAATNTEDNNKKSSTIADSSATSSTPDMPGHNDSSTDHSQTTGHVTAPNSCSSAYMTVLNETLQKDHDHIPTNTDVGAKGNDATVITDPQFGTSVSPNTSLIPNDPKPNDDAPLSADVTINGEKAIGANKGSDATSMNDPSGKIGTPSSSATEPMTADPTKTASSIKTTTTAVLNDGGVKCQESTTKPAKTMKNPAIEDMMLPKLRQLFESAHNKHGGMNHNISIRLETSVAAERFLSMTCFPYLSREQATEHPEIVEQYHKAFRSNTGGPLAIFDLLQERIDPLEGEMITTVEIQVWLLCKERFQVKDLATGMVLQGTTDFSEQIVSHIVRLETNVRQTLDLNETMTTTMENWRIADIDDLIHHKTWYHTS